MTAPLPQPLLTVLTPSLDAATTLADTLASVAAAAAALQARGATLEHWILDGGSTDGTAELVEAHRAQRPWCRWATGLGGGPYGAMNAGLERAMGHYVHVLNADDILLEPEAYGAAVLQAWQRQATVVLSSISYFRRPQRQLRHHWRVSPLPATAASWHGQLRRGLHYPHPGFLAERGRYHGVGFDRRFRLSADYKMMQTLLLGTDPAGVLVVEQPLVAMAEGGASGQWSGIWRGTGELARINRQLGIHQPLWDRYLNKLLRRLRGPAWPVSKAS